MKSLVPNLSCSGLPEFLRQQMYEGPTQLLSVMPREITVEYKIETIRLACDQVANC